MQHHAVEKNMLRRIKLFVMFILDMDTGLSEIKYILFTLSSLQALITNTPYQLCISLSLSLDR